MMERTISAELEPIFLEHMRKTGEPEMFFASSKLAPIPKVLEPQIRREFKAKLTYKEHQKFTEALEKLIKKGLVSDYSVGIINSDGWLNYGMTETFLAMIDSLGEPEEKAAAASEGK